MNNQIAFFKDAWKRQGVLLALLLVALFILYYPSFESMVAIWSRSDTFAHGFIIAPISLWLIWRIRSQLLATEPKANYFGIPLLLGLGLIWLLAKYIDILAAEQLAVVMMIPALVFAVLGWRTTTSMIFPLFFLLLSVPLGEELTPYLIDFTADFTVAMIQFVGIPIYREGNFFQLPSGNWSVVAACSGVRYLIASVTLGMLYAYLNYQGWLKRGVFVFASFVVPIIANGLRAFMIVMIGHFSDMQLATGVDHLIYGWLFFGIVIAIMFYVGSFWQDEDVQFYELGANIRVGNLEGSSFHAKASVMLVGILLVVWPLKVMLEQPGRSVILVPEISVAAPLGWSADSLQYSAWKPSYHGLDREFSMAYQNASGQLVNLYIGYYAEQRQGAELANYSNVLVAEEDERWRVLEKKPNSISLSSYGVEAPVTVLGAMNERLMVSYWYYVGGEVISSKYKTKLLQAKAKLLGTRNDGAVIMISSIYNDESNPPIELLQGFAASILPNITGSLNGLGDSVE